MNPLFITHSEMTLKKYQRFVATIMLHQNRILLAVLCMAGAVALFAFGTGNLGLLILVPFVPVVFLAVIQSKTKKAYQANVDFQGLRSEYRFYDTWFEAESSMGNSRFEYGEVCSVFETGSCFYLMTGKNQGCMIEKANCSQELQEFIKSLTPKKS